MLPALNLKSQFTGWRLGANLLVVDIARIVQTVDWRHHRIASIYYKRVGVARGQNKQQQDIKKHIKSLYRFFSLYLNKLNFYDSASFLFAAKRLLNWTEDERVKNIIFMIPTTPYHLSSAICLRLSIDACLTHIIARPLAPTYFAANFRFSCFCFFQKIISNYHK